MAIKVVSGSTHVKQVTVGSPVRIVRRVKAGDFQFGSIDGIDIAAAEDGSMLVYNGTTENFEAKVEVSNPNTKFNGGNF
jgi:hypothetical protein